MIQRPFTAFEHAVFKNYAFFQGRMRRSEFWWYMLGQWIVLAVVGFFFSMVFNITVPASDLSLANQIVSITMTVLLLIPMLSAQSRRLHDTGLSALWLLLLLIPVIGMALVFVLMLLPARNDGMQYGAYCDYQDAVFGTTVA